MAWLVPALPAITAIGGLATTLITASQPDPGQKAAKAADRDKNERLQREFLASRKQDAANARRSGGSGQRTVLGGDSGATGQTDISRNVLLGQ